MHRSGLHGLVLLTASFLVSIPDPLHEHVNDGITDKAEPECRSFSSPATLKAEEQHAGRNPALTLCYFLFLFLSFADRLPA
jgi:hypothetical protein